MASYSHGPVSRQATPKDDGALPRPIVVRSIDQGTDPIIFLFIKVARSVPFTAKMAPACHCHGKRFGRGAEVRSLAQDIETVSSATSEAFVVRAYRQVEYWRASLGPMDGEMSLRGH